MFDRQISIRTGKAFWSRGGPPSQSSIPPLIALASAFAGPQLCFTPAGSGGVYPTATNNFPDLRFVEETQDDFASLLQARVTFSAFNYAQAYILPRYLATSSSRRS